MSLDPALDAVIGSVIKDSGQPHNVAERLKAWLLAYTEGELSESSELQYFDHLVDQILIPGDYLEAETDAD